MERGPPARSDRASSPGHRSGRQAGDPATAGREARAPRPRLPNSKFRPGQAAAMCRNACLVRGERGYVAGRVLPPIYRSSESAFPLSGAAGKSQHSGASSDHPRREPRHPPSGEIVATAARFPPNAVLRQSRRGARPLTMNGRRMPSASSRSVMVSTFPLQRSTYRFVSRATLIARGPHPPGPARQSLPRRLCPASMCRQCH